MEVGLKMDRKEEVKIVSDDMYLVCDLNLHNVFDVVYELSRVCGLGQTR